MNASLCFGNAKKFLSEIRRLEQVDVAEKLEEIKNKNKSKDKDKDKDKEKMKAVETNCIKKSNSDNISDQSVDSYEAVGGMRLANIHAYQSTTAMLKVQIHTYMHTHIHACVCINTHVLTHKCSKVWTVNLT